jgi:predicted phage terminase large subunit-like protein
LIITPSIERLIPSDKIARLRERERSVAIAEERDKYEGSLLEFVKAAWPSIDTSRYQDTWAIEAMCDHLEAVTLGYIKRLLINVPPRCAKTSIVSILYPAWTWARSDISYLSGPQVKFLCASYDHSLSLDNSNKSRRFFFSPFFQKYWNGKIILQSDQNTKAKFDNTEGGSRIATSVGGGLLGLGGDILIGDDLNNTEVESEAERLTVTSFWNEFSTTRMNDPRLSALINVQQRVHVSDVSGLILNGHEKYVHLMIPMRYDEKRHCVTVKLPQYVDDRPWEDPRTEDGELMWPERFPEEEVRRIESGLTSYMASGRLQQSPVPRGGGIIKRLWWQPWDQVEAMRYGMEWNAGRKEFPPFELSVGSVDTAYGEKEESDFNAMTVWGIWIDRARNRRAMLQYAWQKRVPLHGRVVGPLPCRQCKGIKFLVTERGDEEECFRCDGTGIERNEAKINFQQRKEAEWGIVEWIADTCRKYKVNRLLIEDKTRGRDTAAELQRLYARENWGIELLTPTKDKWTRVHSVVPLFTDNAVWAPDTRWSDEVITQCELFPKDDHDDLVDTVSQFLKWARDNEILVRADEASAALEDMMMFKPKQQTVAEQYGV